MRIKCIANRGVNLPDDCLDPSGGYGKECEFALKIDKEYNVYAITLQLGYVWYYICDEDHYDIYPVWNPSPLFEVVDGRISKYWKYNFVRLNSQIRFARPITIFAFTEWAIDPYEYYYKLTDGDEKEVAIFEHYRGLMDLEFPIISISKKAEDLGRNWVMCPDCDETWEASSENGMLKCPKCLALIHNPLYILQTF